MPLFGIKEVNLVQDAMGDIVAKLIISNRCAQASIMG